MLHGEPAGGQRTCGALSSPNPDGIVPARTVISGFAFSPYGIRAVNLLVNNGAIRLPTELRADAELSRQFPWYPKTDRPRFVARFDRRPAGVWPDTDIQPEIIDGRGNRVLLEDRW